VRPLIVCATQKGRGGGEPASHLFSLFGPFVLAERASRERARVGSFGKKPICINFSRARRKRRARSGARGSD
jgi:hypothetical protein